MMAEDRITLGAIAVVCTIGVAALLPEGHVLLALFVAGVGCFAWYVAIREMKP